MSAGDPDLQALLEERDFLLRSLDDLDDERAAGDIEEADFTALRDDYTARAAAVLRAIDGHDAPEAAAAPAEPVRSLAPRRERGRGPVVAGIVGTLAVAALSGWLVTRSAGERTDGQAATGQDLTRGTTLPEGICDRAFALDEAGKLLEAAQAYSECNKVAGGEPMVLARTGWLLARTGRNANDEGLLAKALGYLDRAVQADPSYPDAHVWRGLVLGYQGQTAASVCELRLYLSTAPAGGAATAQVQGVLDEQLRRLGGQEPACTSGPAFRADSASTLPPSTAPGAGATTTSSTLGRSGP